MKAVNTAAEQLVAETETRGSSAGVVPGVDQARPSGEAQRVGTKCPNESAPPDLVAEVLRCEAAVSWEEVAAHLAEGKMAALGARLAALKARAIELGAARPKVLGMEAGASVGVANEKPDPPPPAVPGEVLTVAEVAACLKVCRTTVENIPPTELPFAHVGKGRERRTRRYRPDDVEAYIARQCARMAEQEEQKQERAKWERAASTKGKGRAGTSGSTARVGGSSSESRRTRATKTSLANAWLKLKDA